MINLINLLLFIKQHQDSTRETNMFFSSHDVSRVMMFHVLHLVPNNVVPLSQVLVTGSDFVYR